MNGFRNVMSAGPPKGLGTLAGVVFGASALGYAGYNSVFTIEAGHRAVMFSRLTGVKQSVYGEGLHFMLPWFEWPIVYDIRTKAEKFSSVTGTRDMQSVSITLRVLSKPSVNNLPSLYQTFGEDYAQRILPSVVMETLKSTLAQYNAGELITQREDVSKKIRSSLEERAAAFNLLIDDVSITHLSFSKDYASSVERKQIAQQEAERAKFVVMQATQDKKSNIIRAQGEAKSAEMIGEALTENPGFIELRKLEAAREIASTLSNSPNKLYLNSNSLLLDLLGEGSSKK